ncbi:MAG: M56 family metallopeptidase [Actinomycetota bacterium]
MQVDRYLFDFSVFLTFSIRIGVVWLLCYVCSRLLRQPSQRFVLWLIFSLGSAAYWIVALIDFIFLAQDRTFIYLHSRSLAQIVVSASWQPVFAALTWLLGGAYMVGLVVLCSFRLWNRLRLRRLLRFGLQPSIEFSAGLEKLCREMGVKRCKLVILPGIASPATAYWLHPHIIFPELAHRPEKLAEFLHILRHELVHVVRRDYLLSSLVDATCTLLFFHPAVWAARRQMRLERELACDREVVQACPEYRADYAASLTQFVRLSLITKRSFSNVPFSSPASLLGRRIRSILVDPVPPPAWNRFSSASLAVTILMTVALFAPQFSVSVDMATHVGPRFTSVRTMMVAQRMKRHIRFTENGLPIR